MRTAAVLAAMLAAFRVRHRGFGVAADTRVRRRNNPRAQYDDDLAKEGDRRWQVVDDDADVSIR